MHKLKRYRGKYPLSLVECVYIYDILIEVGYHNKDLSIIVSDTYIGIGIKHGYWLARLRISSHNIDHVHMIKLLKQFQGDETAIKAYKAMLASEDIGIKIRSIARALQKIGFTNHLDYPPVSKSSTTGRSHTIH